jgi:hypothetical protein
MLRMVVRPMRSARAKVRALRTSPSFCPFSWSTPAPVQAASTISSSSMPSLPAMAMVEV